MAILNVLVSGLRFAGKLMVIGGMTTGQQMLNNKSKEMTSGINGSISRGYDYYAKPKIEKGLSLVKRKK